MLVPIHNMLCNSLDNPFDYTLVSSRQWNQSRGQLHSLKQNRTHWDLHKTQAKKVGVSIYNPIE